MYIDLRKTLKKIADQLPENKTPEPAQLEKAYELTLCLRSQLIAVQYDMTQFGMAGITPAVDPVDQFPQTGKRCRYLHQTHFIGSHRHRQKLKLKKGSVRTICRSKCPCRTYQREGRDWTCGGSNHAPPGQAFQFFNSYKSMEFGYA